MTTEITAKDKIKEIAEIPCPGDSNLNNAGYIIPGMDGSHNQNCPCDNLGYRFWMLREKCIGLSPFDGSLQNHRWHSEPIRTKCTLSEDCPGDCEGNGYRLKPDLESVLMAAKPYKPHLMYIFGLSKWEAQLWSPLQDAVYDENPTKAIINALYEATAELRGQVSE